MRILSFIILMTQSALADEVRHVLAKQEVVNLSSVYPESGPQSGFTDLLKKLGINAEAEFNPQSGELVLSGNATDLKLADFIFLAWVKEVSSVELKFSHFEGDLKNRLVKHSFMRKLFTDKSNSFQFSDKMLKGVGKDINGFSFDIQPVKDILQKELDLQVKLSYKNEAVKFGDRGAQMLDLKTALTCESGKEYLIKITDKSDPGWEKNAFLSFELACSLESKFFTHSIPEEMILTNDLLLRIVRISAGIKELIAENPQRYFEQLGIPFPEKTCVLLNTKNNILLIKNSKENLHLFDELCREVPRDFLPNVTTEVSVYESNLIIKDPDRLTGHTLHKISSFKSICSGKNEFLLSKSFKGEYESAFYITAGMPDIGNKFIYDLTLKTAGPKSRAKNYKFEGHFGGYKKYRVHLDEHHFMEVEVEK